MLTFITGIAALAAAQTAQAAPANPHAQQTAPAGQMDHSKMDHSKMSQEGGGCCTKTADGKMECQMMKGRGSEQGAQGQHQGHSGN